MVTMKTDLKYGEKSGLRLKIEHVHMIIKPRRRKIHSDSDFRRLRRGEGGSDQSIEISRRRGQQSTKKRIKFHTRVSNYSKLLHFHVYLSN